VWPLPDEKDEDGDEALVEHEEEASLPHEKMDYEGGQDVPPLIPSTALPQTIP